MFSCWRYSTIFWLSLFLLKLDVSLTVLPLMVVCLFPLATFKVYSVLLLFFLLFFCSCVITCLGVGSFLCILLGICWISWVCRLAYFIGSTKCSAINLLRYFHCFILSSPFGILIKYIWNLLYPVSYVVLGVFHLFCLSMLLGG